MIINNKHSLSAIFLAFILFTYNINNVAIVIDFLINQDTIAKTLCVQKEEQKGCNGKCQLVKELNLSSNTTNKETPQQNNKISLVECTYIQPINEIDFKTVGADSISTIIESTSYTTIVKYYDIDIPPPMSA